MRIWKRREPDRGRTLTLPHSSATLYDFARVFGFGQPTRISLPGEARGQGTLAQPEAADERGEDEAARGQVTRASLKGSTRRMA